MRPEDNLEELLISDTHNHLRLHLAQQPQGAEAGAAATPAGSPVLAANFESFSPRQQARSGAPASPSTAEDLLAQLKSESDLALQRLLRTKEQLSAVQLSEKRPGDSALDRMLSPSLRESGWQTHPATESAGWTLPSRVEVSSVSEEERFLAAEKLLGLAAKEPGAETARNPLCSLHRCSEEAPTFKHFDSRAALAPSAGKVTSLRPLIAWAGGEERERAPSVRPKLQMSPPIHYVSQRKKDALPTAVFGRRSPALREASAPGLQPRNLKTEKVQTPLKPAATARGLRTQISSPGHKSPALAAAKGAPTRAGQRAAGVVPPLVLPTPRRPPTLAKAAEPSTARLRPLSQFSITDKSAAGPRRAPLYAAPPLSVHRATARKKITPSLAAAAHPLRQVQRPKEVPAGREKCRTPPRPISARPRAGAEANNSRSVSSFSQAQSQTPSQPSKGGLCEKLTATRQQKENSVHRRLFAAKTPACAFGRTRTRPLHSAAAANEPISEYFRQPSSASRKQMGRLRG